MKLKILVPLLGVLFLAGCGQKEPVFTQYADTAMGTVIQLNLYSADAESAENFSKEAMELLNALEKERLSWRLETSEVFRLNASAGAEEGFPLSEELARELAACLDVWEQSEGAFDVTLGAVVRLWKIDSLAAGEISNKDFSIPSPLEISRALEKCGSEHLKLVEGEAATGQTADGETGGDARIFLPEGMQIDLGAVGKGIALSELETLLKCQPDISAAVISAGGSILVYGAKADNSTWKVGIVNPLDTSSSIGTLVLEPSNWYITTSGDYERYVEVDGVLYHHIIDPATGYPAEGDVRGVTILTRDGLLGDALSTACFVLGVEEGLKLVEKYDAEALFVLADGEIVLSEGLQEKSAAATFIAK